MRAIFAGVGAIFAGMARSYGWRFCATVAGMARFYG